MDHVLMPIQMPSPVTLWITQKQRSWLDDVQHPQDMFSNGVTNFLLALLIWAGSIYFLPTIIVTFNRRKEVKSGIILLNIFLGWTFIGWIVALVLSLQSDTIVVYRDK